MSNQNIENVLTESIVHLDVSGLGNQSTQSDAAMYFKLLRRILTSFAIGW